MDKRERFVLAALLLGFLVVSAYLPSAGAGIYNSPDETANAVVAEQIATHGSAVITPAGDAEGFPWVHPRSWIGLPGKIAPVGFFGWPVLLALLRRVFGAWILPWVGGWILASAIIPLYFLLRKKFDVAASAIGVIVAFSFPAMILYANRGLFSNGPVLALGLWTFWLLLRAHERGWTPRSALLVGALAGITLSIRPVEAVWMVPWGAFALVKSQKSIKSESQKHALNKDEGSLKDIIEKFSSVIPSKEGIHPRSSGLGWIPAGVYPAPSCGTGMTEIKNVQQLKMATYFSAGFLLGALPTAIFAWNAYGSPFIIGYWLREVPSAVNHIANIATSTATSFFPFGIHPRNIWWNVRSFLFGIAWPWTGIVLVASAKFIKQALSAAEGSLKSIVKNADIAAKRFLSLRAKSDGARQSLDAPTKQRDCFVVQLLAMTQRRFCKVMHKVHKVKSPDVLLPSTVYRIPSVPILLSFFTILWLLVLYGSGLYADHVRVGAVTVGNSFLRYMMPMALLAGWAAASLLPRMRPAWMRVVVVMGIAIFGGWRAFAADDEGLRFVRRELFRYQHIRQETSALLPADAVIFSERSDKIFFPTFRAVSPLPQKEQIARFAGSSHLPLALFSRPLSQRDKDDWMSVGLETQELQPFGRETLYRLVSRSASP